ncbi:MAG TPA: hypothetical protein VFK03_01585, partial [Candidatus Saccharimonadales bacterium]|nr:hypothetical protein [Candidatus Saccharimonadales bacterium]
YLVTKMNFPISTIPTFVALSKMLIHLCLLAVVIIILLIQGDHVSLYWLQLPFYTILMGGFFIAWSLFAAPLAAISKDFANLVRSMVRVLFWMSGIIWSLDTIQNHVVHVIFMFNPITFFANGYRQALLSQGWFFDEPERLAAFGVVMLVMIGLAYVTFKRARKEIVDAL